MLPTKAAQTCSASAVMMAIEKISREGITHPFGDHRAVKQAFPAGVSSHESDPFLMCDYFDTEEKKGRAKHEDDFPVGWHPHRGFDIASYLKSGVGRHGDSLGNRETFETPGMQWMSVGSGVEHAEGGANDKGTLVQGFQIWINVPSEHKMDDPDYGTVSDADMPVLSIGTKEGSRARILAGPAFGNENESESENENGKGDECKSDDGAAIAGPFRTKQAVQMIDLELQPGDTFDFEIARDLDTAILYVYEGSLASVNRSDEEEDETNPSNATLEMGSIVLFDASSNDRRKISLIAASESESASASASGSSTEKTGALLFAGKKLREPIAWHGPIVMNTQEQIYETFRELRSGTFPPKRVAWDYKDSKSRPVEAEGE